MKNLDIREGRVVKNTSRKTSTGSLNSKVKVDVKPIDDDFGLCEWVSTLEKSNVSAKVLASGEHTHCDGDIASAERKKLPHDNTNVTVSDTVSTHSSIQIMTLCTHAG